MSDLLMRGRVLRIWARARGRYFNAIRGRFIGSVSRHQPEEPHAATTGRQISQQAALGHALRVRRPSGEIREIRSNS